MFMRYYTCTHVYAHVGHDDENYPFALLDQNLDSPQLSARYSALGKMKPGIRRYNMFWSSMELVPSSEAPMQCPQGQILVPSDPQQKLEQGYVHRFMHVL